MPSRFLTVLLTASSWLAAAASAADSPVDEFASKRGPIAPADTLSLFQIAPGCRIELVAAEPDVVSPVHIAFDPEGRLWVVEYSDYPHGPADSAAGTSRIRVLTDDDGDGRFENPRTFADHLLFANGLTFWRDGVLVTHHGALTFFRDTDGDGAADFREDWFSGFADENPQLRANNPTFALDNHIYISNGLRGGRITAVKEGWRHWPAVDLRGRDLRFDPRTGAFETVSGISQFGHSFDDWGGRYLCSNRNPCDRVLYDEVYLRRNPDLPPPSVVEHLSPPAEKSRVYPISRSWTTSSLHAGTFTSACGICIFRGDALPQEVIDDGEGNVLGRFESYYGTSFVCEPTGNLVHHDDLTLPACARTNSDDPREFLATTDEWFRPVNLANGPDGALYVVDMYRAVIEHPDFMPEELRQRPDLLRGVDCGRIYRIVAADAPAPGRLPVFDRSTPGLIAALAQSNAWQREQAQRRLLERLSDNRDASAIESLKTLSREGRAPSRVQALWLLHALGELDWETLDYSLTHPDSAEDEEKEGFDPPGKESGVRVTALRLAELGFANDARALERILELLPVQEAGRRSLVLSLGAWEWSDKAGDALAAVLDPDIEHHSGLPSDEMCFAVALTSGAHAADVLVALFNRPVRYLLDTPFDDRGMTGTYLATLVGARGERTEIERCLRVLPEISQNDLRLPALEVLASMIAGYERRGRRWREFSEQCDVDLQQQLRACSVLAASLAVEARREPSRADQLDREQMLRVLGGAAWDVASEPLRAYVANPIAPEFADQDVLPLRRLAIELLARWDEPEVTEFFIEQLSTQTPAVKSALIAACLARPDRISRLLDEIEAGRLSPRELDITQSQSLQKHAAATIAARAKQLLAAPAAEDRTAVLATYRPALTAEGDMARGRALFTKTCANCHRIGEIGVNVAPDISDTRTKTAEQLLAAILDPNAAIDSNYFAYTLIDRQGVVTTGVIAGETATSLTLRQSGGKEVVVLRDDVEELRSSGASLMPVGLERDISVEQMSDLLSFLKNWRYAPGDSAAERP